jgi:hypothetical protein
MFEGNDEAPIRRTSIGRDRVKRIILLCWKNRKWWERYEMEKCAREVAVSIDMCGLQMDVCGLMLGVGY